MLIICAVIIMLYITVSSPLYLHLGEGERKCFIEDIPGETMVKVSYRAEMNDFWEEFKSLNSVMSMHIETRGPDNRIISSKVYGSEGTILFRSYLPGEHVVCLSGNSSNWCAGAHLRLHLDILVGARAINYETLALRGKLSPIQLRVKQLLYQVEQINKEQDYQRDRAKTFRKTSEAVNQRMLKWSLTQACILLVIMIGWQFRCLTNVFEVQKPM